MSAALLTGPLTADGCGWRLVGGASAGEKAFGTGSGSGSSAGVGSGDFDDGSARLTGSSGTGWGTEVTAIGAESGRGEFWVFGTNSSVRVQFENGLGRDG